MAAEQAILRAIYEQNPWWTGGAVPEELVKPFRGTDFFALRQKMDEKEITAIIGPRQVGKTTVLYQLVDSLIREKGADPGRVMYFSFDYPRLAISINEVLDVYSTSVLREPLQGLRAPVYVLLDEVCRVEGWSRLLKGWYDLKYPIKFVVSHSSSSDVLRGASESLAGRIAPFLMHPLKFADAVRYYAPEVDVSDPGIEMREAFSRTAVSGDAGALFASLGEAMSKLAPFESLLKTRLQEYLLKDGPPGLLGVNSLRECSQRLRDYLSLTLYKDVVQIFGIRNPAALEDLVTLLADASSGLTDCSALSHTLSMKLDTVKSYMDYLEAVFLISREEFYSKSRAARIRKQEKVYMANTGLRNALLGQLNESLLADTTALGRVVETVVHGHCLRLQSYLSGSPARLFYWRTPHGYEVDIVMEAAQRPVPIEVTYTIPQKRLKGLDEFERMFDPPFSVVVTRDAFDLGSRRICIPLWLFLLMC